MGRYEARLNLTTNLGVGRSNRSGCASLRCFAASAGLRHGIPAKQRRLSSEAPSGAKEDRRRRANLFYVYMLCSFGWLTPRHPCEAA